MKAIFDRIYNDLLEHIETGKYPYQSFLPSESELAKDYTC